MKRILITILLLLLAGIVVERNQKAAPFNMPDCNEVKNSHYSGPCMSMMIDGIITGDETEEK